MLGIRIHIKEKHILNAGYKVQVPHTYSRLRVIKQFVSSYNLPRFHILQVAKGEYYIHYDFLKNGEHKTKTSLCEETYQEIKRLKI